MKLYYKIIILYYFLGRKFYNFLKDFCKFIDSHSLLLSGNLESISQGVLFLQVILFPQFITVKESRRYIENLFSF